MTACCCRLAGLPWSDPAPPRLKLLPFALCYAGKMWIPQICNITEGDELLIILPFEQQLPELKPNGSNVGNRGIPTLSGCRRNRMGAVRNVGERRHSPSPVDPLRVLSTSESARQAAPWSGRSLTTVGPPGPILGLLASRLRQALAISLASGMSAEGRMSTRVLHLPRSPSHPFECPGRLQLKAILVS